MFRRNSENLIINYHNNAAILIEILLAASILIIGIIALILIQFQHIQGRGIDSVYSEAAIAAKNQLNRLQNLSFDAPDLDPAANPHTENQTKHIIQWTVTDTDTNADGVIDAKMINLMVMLGRYWNTNSGQPSLNIDFIKINI